MDDVTRHLLTQAAQEIRRLRQQNEVLGVQVAVVEVFRAALLGPPAMGMVSDLCHAIDVELAKDAEERAN